MRKQLTAKSFYTKYVVNLQAILTNVVDSSCRPTYETGDHYFSAYFGQLSTSDAKPKYVEFKLPHAEVSRMDLNDLERSRLILSLR